MNTVELPGEFTPVWAAFLTAIDGESTGILERVPMKQNYSKYLFNEKLNV